MRRALWFAAALALGCAAAPRYRASSPAPGGATASTVATVDEASPESVNGAATYATPPVREPLTGRIDRDGLVVRPAPSTPSSVEAAPPAPTAQSGPAEPGERWVALRVGAQVQRIRDEQIRLAASAGVCQDVCSAAGTICLAAQEVCRLTSDDDPRCARARGACSDAGRQRDGSCPVCPPAR